MNNEIKFLPPFKRMCMSIGTLPSSFYASMSYYESMVWLYEYLKNEVIPVVNNNSEVTEEIQTAFTQLEEYITTYFDNLDVQHEVDVKLDEMAEDGTLADMVAEYVKMQGQLVYNTVADMQSAENIQNGSFMKTYGFHSINDGGSAFYKARNITNEDVIDNMTLFALNDVTLVAELLPETIMTPEQLGAYGDNSHNDLNAFQKIINICNLIKCNKGKTYIINDELLIDSRSNLSIDGNGSTIKFTGENKVLFRMNGTCKNIEIKNFKSEGTITSDSSTYTQVFIGNNSLETNSFEYIKIHDNEIHNYSIGITVNADYAGHLKFIEIYNNKIYDIFMSGPGRGYGIHISDGLDEDIQAIVKNNDISTCSSHCLYMARGSSYTITNNFIHDNHAELVSDLTPAVNLSRSKNILFEHNTLKNIKNGGLMFSSELNPLETYPLTSYPCENIIINNNLFIGPSNQHMLFIGYGDPTVAFSKNITITNNILENAARIGVYGVDNLKIDNNYFNLNINDYGVTVIGVGTNTSNLYTDNITISNNQAKVIEGNNQPFRLNANVITRDTNITFINNIVNTGKIIRTASNVSNNKIKVINQVFNNDFYFDSSYAFAPVYVNNVDITS